MRFPSILCIAVNGNREIVANRLAVKGSYGLVDCPRVFIPTKSKSIASAVIIHVDYGIPFRRYVYILVKSVQMKTGVPIISAVNTCIGTISVALLADSTYSCIYVSRQTDMLLIVVSIPCNILFPNDDRVSSCTFCGPLGIDCSGLAESPSEREFIAGCAGSIFIPAAERVAVPYHFKEPFVARDFTRFNESRSIISGTLAVLIKDKPVALR